MAKSKSFFGLRTGSTKSLTFQVYKGQQITKDRVTRISNPRTESQMKQRAIIPIVAAARSALKGLLGHSFEGVAYGEASLKEFSKLNLRAGALSVFSYSPNGVSNPGFANLIVSNGSINVPYLMDLSKVASYIHPYGDFPSFSFPKVDEGESADVILKYLESYAKANNVAILAPGTQLSFLTIYQSGTVKVATGYGTTDAPTSGFILDRIYIPNGDSDSEKAKEVNDKWKVLQAIPQGAMSVDLINSNGDVVEFSCGKSDLEKGQLTITYKPKETSTNSNSCGMAMILSRYIKGVWKRSRARLNILHTITTPYTFEDWLSTYQTTGAASKKYLNAGDEGSGIQG